MEKTEVFGYVRVSTAGQVKEGFSLEQQKEEIVNGYWKSPEGFPNSL